MTFDKLISNKLDFVKDSKFTVIIGSSPSKTAKSPKIWNALYKKNKINCKMHACDTKIKNLKKLVKYLTLDKNFLGGAITEPYKSKILKFVSHQDNAVKQLGAANIILKKNNKLYAFNTDYLAIKENLNQLKKKFKIKNIAILGCGGVGKSAIVAAKNIFKKKKIFIFLRKNKNNLKFEKKVKSQYIKFYSYGELINHKSISLLINATTIGFPKMVKIKGINIDYKKFSPLAFDKVELIMNKNVNQKKLIDLNVKYMNLFKLKNKDVLIFDLIYNQDNLLKKLSKKNHLKYLDGSFVNKKQAEMGFAKVNKI